MPEELPDFAKAAIHNAKINAYNAGSEAAKWRCLADEREKELKLLNERLKQKERAPKLTDEQRRVLAGDVKIIKDKRVARPLRPNLGIEAEYKRRLKKLVDEMNSSIEYWLTAAYKANEPHVVNLAEDADFKESEHPRDRAGKFTAGGGGSSSEPQTVYHGTNAPGFSKFNNPDPGQYMPDRGLGIHVAKDPEVAGTFAHEGGGLYQLTIPPDNKFYEIEQPLLPYVKPGTPKTPRNVYSDQNVIESEIYRVAYRQDPAMFARFLQQRWNVSSEAEAKQAAEAILSGKPFQNGLIGRPGRPIVGLNDYIDFDGVVKSWNAEDRAKAVQLFKDHLKEKGYVGVKYINTSPMETEHAKDPTSYVVFDPRDIKSKLTGAAMDTALLRRLAMDALPANILRKVIRELARRWQRKFNEASLALAEWFSKAVHTRSNQQLHQILKRGGWTTEIKLTKAQRDILQATIQQNVSLIRSIPSQHFTQIEGMVMRSVQTGRDLQQLTQDLRHSFGVTRRRAELIARDQNAKAFTALTRARQLELGIQTAIWVHSHAGKTPRPTHLRNDGQPYDIEVGWYDPAVQRYVWPGELISCRCFSRPIIPGFS